MIGAAHCFDDFDANANEKRKIKLNSVRAGTQFNESIEIKRVYKHPNYKFPLLYDDVAIIELGRRIEYDYNKFGDTPTCVDQDQKPDVYTGAIANIQGYGKTEKGEHGDLLETDVKVLSNQECGDMLTYNTTKKKAVRRQGTKHLPIGINYGMFCAQGEQTEEGIFKGSCKGDSGGPLQTYNPNNQDRQTLIGIVSGGIGCGRGIPGWYTKVSFHINWIKCIIDKSVQYKNNQKLVEEDCKSQLVPEPACINPNDLVFGLDEFKTYNKK